MDAMEKALIQHPRDDHRHGIVHCQISRADQLEQNIKVAQYLTVLPEKQWFIDKMNRSIVIARELQDRKETE